MAGSKASPSSFGKTARNRPYFPAEQRKSLGVLTFCRRSAILIDSLGGDARASNYELSRHSTKWRGRLTRKDVFRVGVRCGSVETCRKGRAVLLRSSEVDIAEAIPLTPERWQLYP